MLGLTIAEMFILLIFLLLIAFLGLANHWQKERQEFSASEQRLYEWRDIIDSHTPDEIKTLTSKAPMFEKQTDELDRSREENKILHEEKEEWKREQETLSRQVEAAKQEAIQARNENNTLHKEKEALNKQLETAKQETMQEGIADKKGPNPPCWYKVVGDKKGKKREKTHYLFNIAVHDDYMVVQRRQYPPGRAENDNGLPYVEEARHLGLEHIAYDEPLTDEKLKKYMRPIYDSGKNSEVRSYSCIFYVLVWDKTSPNAKKRWQQAHEDVLQELFGTLRVKNDAWPVSP